MVCIPGFDPRLRSEAATEAQEVAHDATTPLRTLATAPPCISVSIRFNPEIPRSQVDCWPCCCAISRRARLRRLRDGTNAKRMDTVAKRMGTVAKRMDTVAKRMGMDPLPHPPRRGAIAI